MKERPEPEEIIENWLYTARGLFSRYPKVHLQILCRAAAIWAMAHRRSRYTSNVVGKIKYR
jgi:hypothetical protein